MKFFKFLNKEVEKAYTEGIYADTPQNRKLGRVGMSYIEYASKENKEKDIQLTEKEKNYIKEYVSGERMWINQYLRDPSLDIVLDSKEDKEFLQTLQKVTSQKLNRDIIKQPLYRSVDASAFFKGITDLEYDALISKYVYNNKEKLIQETAEKALKKLQKQTTDPGFISTTKSQEVAENWGGFTGAEHPIVLRINTNDKTKGYDLKDFDIEDDKQYEVLLGQNQIMKVKDIYGNNGNLYLDIDI